MKILFLHAEIMGYTLATLRALTNMGAEIHIVHWDHRKKSLYVPESVSKIFMHSRSLTSNTDIHKLVAQFQPNITVISGWMDRGYLEIAYSLRAKNKTVVLAFDNQWTGELKQVFAMLLGKIGVLRKFYSHAWVAGIYQYEFARRLGYCKNEIAFDLYSADVDLFENTYNLCINNRINDYPKKFLFVGRLEPIKGLLLLIEAWTLINKEQASGWELQLVGSGSMSEEIEKVNGISVRPFMSPDELQNEIYTSGCFVLPSLGEPWGVVVHEFACAGLPLIVSDVVGASSVFLIDNANGYKFKAGNCNDLAEKMTKFMNLTDDEKVAMSDISRNLSRRISPQTSAMNLLSIL